MTTCHLFSDCAIKKFYFIILFSSFTISQKPLKLLSHLFVYEGSIKTDLSYALVDKGTDAPEIWCNIDDDFGKRPSAFHFGSMEELKWSHSESGVSLQLYYEHLCFVICSQCYGSFTGLYLQVGKYKCYF